MRIANFGTLAAIGILWLLAAAACGGESVARVAEPLVRDSAGIRIVENQAPVLPEGRRWRVDPEPWFTVGVLEGAPEYQFDQVAGVRVLSDGRVVVANGGSSEIRYFAADGGAYVKASGRRGSGPGEFQRITAIFALPGDTIAISEVGRLQYFGPDGEFVRLVNTAAIDERPMGVSNVLPDGSLIASPYIAVSVLQDVYGTMFHVSPELAVRDSLPPLLFRRVASGPMQHRGVFPAGRGVAGTDRIYHGYSDTYGIEVYALDGRQTGVIRREFAPKPLAASDVSRLRRHFEERSTRPASPQNPRFTGPQVPGPEFPETLPAFSALLVDVAGNLWVEEYRLAGEYPEVFGENGGVHSSWSVFDPEGVWLTDVELPGGFRPMDVGDDYVAGTALDDLGVESVRVYALVKP